MKLKARTQLAGLIAAGLLMGAPAAFGAATIINAAGTLALGINDQGHLNTTVGSVATNGGGFTGLAFKFPDGSFRDATAPGCLCEGWGVSVNGTTSGYANVAVDGVVNLTTSSFTSTASTATSTVRLTSLPGLTVTQAYSAADTASSALFKDVVTITNGTLATVNNVKYVRVMDWDVPPTEFSELVTIRGTATTSLRERSHDGGFSTANPLGGDAFITAGTVNTDFTDSGPTDHGAYFRFNFGSLAAGESRTFKIFYGATASEREALAAIGQEGIELFSLGQSDGNGTSGTPATFIFGFQGVGGVPIIPPPGIPEPGSLALVSLALLGAGAMRRRKALRG